MSFEACIDAALKSRKITGKNRDFALDRYKNFLSEYTKKMGPDAAAQKAADDATNSIAAELSAKKRMRHMTVVRIAEGVEEVSRFKGGNIGEALRGFVSYDPRAPYMNYTALNVSLRGQYAAMVADLVDKYKPHEVLGKMKQETAGLDNFIRDLFEEGSGDPTAKAFAKAFKEMSTFARERFVAAGGILPELEDWRFPQYQDPVKLRATKMSDWVDEHTGWMDWNKIRYPDGKLVPLEERQAFLEAAFKAKLTDGAINPSTPHKKALGDQSASRVLKYKDSESWLAMHAKYGDGTVYDSIVNHMDNMAHLTAMTEVFSPNPDAFVESLKGVIANKAAKLDVDANGATSKNPLKKEKFFSGEIKKSFDTFDNEFAVINGQTAARPENQFGQAMSGTRNLLASALLAGATPAAIYGDLASSRFVANMNGMGEMKLFSQYLKNMNPFDPTHRRIAARMGFVNDNAMAIGVGQRRFADVENSNEGLTRYVSDTTFRMTLMSPHTQMARYAANTELLGLLTDSAGKPFNDLPFKETLEKHGIGEADWAAYSEIPDTDFGSGAVFKHPKELKDTRLGDRIMTMIVDEGRRMVPDSTVQGRAAFVGSTRGGTLSGELLRSAAMFRGFPMGIYYLIMRDAVLKASMKDRVSYISTYMLYMTMAGAVTLQTKELLAGRDPLAMLDTSDPKRTAAFWGNAILRGGGLGVFGDFLFSDLNSYGRGLPETLAGPMAQFMGDSLNLSFGNALQALLQEDTDFAIELNRYVQSYTPKPFYARLLLERMFFDNVTAMVDPKARQKIKRAERRALEERGQTFWWGRGESAPRRPPNVDLVRGL
jgi:hypothetical protein